jgi:uncharacterized repeat protein (TIGR01451 family)
MASKIRTLGPTTLLALAAFAAALLFSPPAQPAPGDVADLAVTKTDSPDPVNVGAVLTYTIQVTNLGPQNATNVTVTDRLPGRTDFISATSTSGTCDRKGKEVTCNIGNLAADPSKANAVTVTIQVRPTKKGTLKNKASVDSVETDPVGANDSAEASTTVIEPVAASCRGVAATITGTAGADSLIGTAGPDVIAALAGADAIVSLAGADLACAGGGNDRVVSGTAADRVYGDGGRDRLLGRGGPDLLAGGGRNDVLKGGRGNDRLRGGRGFDRCYGGAGLDTERGCEV